jgi:hypothetical protein
MVCLHISILYHTTSTRLRPITGKKRGILVKSIFFSDILDNFFTKSVYFYLSYAIIYKTRFSRMVHQLSLVADHIIKKNRSDYQ